MNKNISITLNVILFIAVGVLFYLHFSCGTACTSPAGAADTTAAKPVVAAPKEIKASKIVYVNIDQLNEKYEFLKDITTAAKSEHTALQGQSQAKGKKLKKVYAEFQQSA